MQLCVSEKKQTNCLIGQWSEFETMQFHKWRESNDRDAALPGLWLTRKSKGSKKGNTGNARHWQPNQGSGKSSCGDRDQESMSKVTFEFGVDLSGWSWVELRERMWLRSLSKKRIKMIYQFSGFWSRCEWRRARIVQCKMSQIPSFGKWITAGRGRSFLFSLELGYGKIWRLGGKDRVWHIVSRWASLETLREGLYKGLRLGLMLHVCDIKTESPRWDG